MLFSLQLDDIRSLNEDRLLGLAFLVCNEVWSIANRIAPGIEGAAELHEALVICQQVLRKNGDPNPQANNLGERMRANNEIDEDTPLIQRTLIVCAACLLDQIRNPAVRRKYILTLSDCFIDLVAFHSQNKEEMRSAIDWLRSIIARLETSTEDALMEIYL
jgi:hypothetical protein